MGLEFTLVDVFSDRPFGGNQLAVFPDAEGIPDQTMQQIAREFNFSETTFVLPPEDPSHAGRVRIFTPQQELPFAGHPTVGTAAVLAQLPEVGKGQDRWTFVLEEGIGPVRIVGDGPSISLCLRRPEYESSDEVPPLAGIATALSLPEDLVLEAWYAGVGLRFCLVRLADADAVDRAVLDKTAWAAAVADSWSPHLYLFAGDLRDDSDLYARMFAPAFGIDEDPATGSACATLVASLADRSPQQDGTYRLRLSQGVAMGRPSALEGTARKVHGQIAEVLVGGRATIIGTGTMTFSAQ
jgi:trans-2,3-dihydro-3-hydroxyanthranilate isomerase